MNLKLDPNQLKQLPTEELVGLLVQQQLVIEKLQQEIERLKAIQKLDSQASSKPPSTGLFLKPEKPKMKFEDIYQFFQDPGPNYLNKELAVCYVLSALIEGESYGTHLIQQLEHEYPTYRLSDTVLYIALKFLEEAGAITGYWKRVEGRGRPRRTYQISSDWRDKARELAGFWCRYITQEKQEI